MQSDALATEQLDNKLSPIQKLEFLTKQLSISRDEKKWSDLGLGCIQLFGTNLYHTLCAEVPQSLPFYQVINRLSNSNTRFTLVSHDYPTLFRQLIVWPNATVIFFTNETAFLQEFRPDYRYQRGYLNFWKNVKGPDWPEFPPYSSADIKQLPTFIQQELIELFNDDIQTYVKDDSIIKQVHDYYQPLIEQVKQTNATATWDCNWYFNAEECVNHIELLYQQLGLLDFNKDLVTKLYKSWHESITAIKNNNLAK